MKRKPNEKDVQLGKLIKQIRQHKGVKSVVVAKALGCNEGNYSKIENGKIGLNFWNLLIICDALDCSILQLCALLNIDVIHKGAIKNWDEFFESTQTLDEAEKRKLHALAHDILFSNNKV